MEIGIASLIAEGSAPHVDESRAFYAARQAAGGQRGPANYEELKAARSCLPTRPAERPAVERTISVGQAQVPVRIMAPASGESRATYLDIHGGGFYMDSAARSDAHNARLADALGVTVVSVEYRLAPEYPWPAAPDDCERAALWLLGEGSNPIKYAPTVPVRAPPTAGRRAPIGALNIRLAWSREATKGTKSADRLGVSRARL